jgi:hypothetical protein
MEAVVSAIIVGVLGLAGTVLTVWRSRSASTNQHIEQTTALKTIQHNQGVMLDLIKAHRETAELQLRAVHDRVDSLAVGHETLFGLLVEVDQKVTKSSNKRKVSTGLVEILQG